MKHFIDILIENEFKPMIKKKDGSFEPKKENNMDFSTMREGGLITFWKKGDKIIMWGLNEFGKPPTLIIDFVRQDVIEDVLRNNDHNIIFDKIMNDDLSIFN